MDPFAFVAFLRGFADACRHTKRELTCIEMHAAQRRSQEFRTQRLERRYRDRNRPGRLVHCSARLGVIMRPSGCLIFAVSTALTVCSFSGCGGESDSTGGGSDAGAVYDDCVDNSDCVIRPATCCGQCGAATRDDIVPLNKDRVSAYERANCEETFGCPACYMAQDARLVATCNAGKCIVVDLAQHASTACAATSECRIRTNVCCECGGPTDVEHLIAVAVEAEASVSALVCDEGQACPECAPIYPAETTAACMAGRCEAVSEQP